MLAKCPDMNVISKWNSLLLVFAAALGVSGGEVAASDTNAPMVVIHTVTAPLGNQKVKPQVIAAIWEDGRAVWAAAGPSTRRYLPPRTLEFARQRGGPPFQQGRIAKEKLEELWRVLDNERTRADHMLGEQIKRWQLAPGDSGTTIVLNRGAQPWKIESRHEKFEESGKFIMTAYGPEALDGRDREKVLSLQPGNYRNFRTTWSKIREAVKIGRASCRERV